MEKQNSIYFKRKLNVNFFLPESTKDLYKKKKNLYSELDKIYEKITGKTPIYEEDKLNIASCLYQDIHLRKVILRNMSDYSTKKTLENLSKINDISNYQLKKIKKVIKDTYIEQILEYKKENNTLTYTDLKKLKRNSQEDIEQKIIDQLKTNHKYTYSEIARKYNLRDGRVAKKIIEKNYADIYWNFEEKEEDKSPINKYEIAA